MGPGWRPADRLPGTKPHRTALRDDRCRYAELYQRLGMHDLGYCLSCSRDPAFARGFNPRLTLTRTRTIMEGAYSCDFLSRLE